MDNSEMLTPIIGYTLDKEFSVYCKDFNVVFFPSYKKKDSLKTVPVQNNQVWVETLAGQRIALIYPRYKEDVPALISHNCEGVVEFTNFQDDGFPDKIKEIIFYGGCLDYLFEEERPVPIIAGSDIVEVRKDGTLQYTEQGEKANRSLIVGTYQRLENLDCFNTFTVRETYLNLNP